MKKKILLIIFMIILVQKVEALEINKNLTNNIICYSAENEANPTCFNMEFIYGYGIDKYVVDINLPTKHKYDENYVFNNETKQAIKKLLHYGYDYDHQISDTMYVVTQIKLWELLYPEYEFNYQLDSNITQFDKVYNDLTNLVNEVKMPTFQDIILKEGEHIERIDYNDVIVNSVVYASDIDFVIDGNIIKYNGVTPGDYKIVFRVDYPFYTDLAWYPQDNTKYLPWQYTYSDFIEINVKVLPNHIVMNSFEEKKYGMYDENNTLLGVLNISVGNSTYILDPSTHYIAELDNNNEIIESSKIMTTGSDNIDLCAMGNTNDNQNESYGKGELVEIIPVNNSVDTPLQADSISNPNTKARGAGLLIICTITSWTIIMVAIIYTVNNLQKKSR